MTTCADVDPVTRPGLVETRYFDGRRLLETPEEFRARLGLAVCDRCQMPVPVQPFGSRVHVCKWLRSTYIPEYETGVDAWFSTRISRTSPRSQYRPLDEEDDA